MKHANKYLAVFTLLALLTEPLMADPPAEKGKGNDKSAQQANPSLQQSNDANHGQVVSECNHRANQRNLKGQDRKQWVEWCTDHGQRFSYENKRWSDDRTCYQKADNRNLSGDARRAFVRDCLSRLDRTRYDYDARGEPRAKDVPGKGSK
jgi:hypothetical protein